MSRLRLLLNLAGDWLYAGLVTLGWQPREEREKAQADPGSR